MVASGSRREPKDESDDHDEGELDQDGDQHIHKLLLPRSLSTETHLVPIRCQNRRKEFFDEVNSANETPGNSVRYRGLKFMPEEGLEPSQPEGHQILNLARLPVPPPWRGIARREHCRTCDDARKKRVA